MVGQDNVDWDSFAVRREWEKIDTTFGGLDLPHFAAFYLAIDFILRDEEA